MIRLPHDRAEIARAVPIDLRRGGWRKAGQRDARRQCAVRLVDDDHRQRTIAAALRGVNRELSLIRARYLDAHVAERFAR